MSFPKSEPNPRIARLQRYADILNKGAIAPHQRKSVYEAASFAPALGNVLQGLMAGSTGQQVREAEERQKLAKILVADPNYRRDMIPVSAAQPQSRTITMPQTTPRASFGGALKRAFVPQRLTENEILDNLRGMSPQALEIEAGFEPHEMAAYRRELATDAAKASKVDRSQAYWFGRDSALEAGHVEGTDEFSSHVLRKMDEFIVKSAGGFQMPHEKALLDLDIGIINANSDAIVANDDVKLRSKALFDFLAPNYSPNTGMSTVAVETSKATPWIKKILEIGDAFGLLNEDEQKKLGQQQSFEALVAFLVPRMRPVGSGATSDMEVAMFKRAVPALWNTTEGNQLIAGFFLQNLDYQKRVNTARIRYMRDHRNLDEFDSWLESEIENGNFKSNVTNYQRSGRNVNDDISEGKIREGEVFIDKDGDLKVMDYGRHFALQNPDGSKRGEDLQAKDHLGNRITVTWQMRKEKAEEIMGINRN